VNIPKFKQYLTKLREVNGDAKLCIFMDNLTTHTSKKTRKTMQDLHIKALFNLSYSPDLNPIESTFSKVKQKFKVLRIQKLTGQISDSYETIINKAVKSLRKQDIVNCIDYAY
jgi:hypothetical protein